jgi:hypothetical protein
MIAPSDRKAKIWSVIRVSSGNFLEMYDFMVFGYYASAIGKVFFPSGNPFVSLMLSLMTFGAGFLTRPLGAIVLGAYADHHGRRAGLMLTLSLMSVGILTIACMPGYDTIGLLAPLFVLIGRLLQGFSAGMELGGVSVYLVGDRHSRTQGLLCQLAIGESTSCRDVCRARGSRSKRQTSSRENAGVGMASPFAPRLRDYSVPVLAQTLPPRDG